MYIVTDARSSSSAGGIIALLMRSQLAQPNEHVFDAQTYNRGVHDARDDDDLPRSSSRSSPASRTSSCR
mgnify:CR=1 FL=1